MYRARSVVPGLAIHQQVIDTLSDNIFLWLYEGGVVNNMLDNQSRDHEINPPFFQSLG